MATVFFYGLFMDKDLLEKKGLTPKNVRPACLKGYQLKIGQRATLVPADGSESYGTIMEMDDEELTQLYSGDGVEEYLPEIVEIQTMTGQSCAVTSYILPPEKTSGRNSEYAAQLAKVAWKLHLPDAYINEIESWI
ncbi:MAG: gamma-glutamylcyclotransferase family protein [Pseudomonadota bacterium]